MNDKDDIERVRRVLKDTTGINFKMPDKITYVDGMKRQDKMKKIVAPLVICLYWFIVLSPTIIMWELYRFGIISIRGVWEWFLAVIVIVISVNIMSYLIKMLRTWVTSNK